MVKYIKRTTDNKFLNSLENDVWVDNVKDALSMSYKDCKENMETLLNSYSEGELKEVVDFTKSIDIPNEEKEELLNLLKK